MSASTFRTPHPARTTTGTRTAAAGPAGHPASAGRAYPSLTTTVPKEFVHRASIAEVLLTDWARLDEHRFTVAAQWPRGHSFFTSTHNCHDPLMVAETFRQAGMLLAHTELGVPLGYQLLVRDLGVHIKPEHLGVGATPATVELHMTATDVRQRGGILTSCRYDAVIHRDGHPAGTAHGTVTCMAPATYRRIRTLHGPHTTQPPLTLTAPLAPQLVGRSSPKDVVLSPTTHPGQWRLRVDPTHPILFDHPLDHVPGMLLLEAARQSTTATLGHTTPPHHIDSTFTRYVELNTPCLIHTTTHPTTTPHQQTLTITAHQNNHPAFHCTITLPTP
ncbi:ScbA/BarX family gamma-butyrolactone biosynthesis protein [Streptomyces werraensis]|uniref:ScbA/BarX family gamma-butyrolactone biosynthesis protein n=1 Tax=Streptomyces werraensis TaxID=68284 RepID=UPI0036C074B9